MTAIACNCASCTGQRPEWRVVTEPYTPDLIGIMAGHRTRSGAQEAAQLYIDAGCTSATVEMRYVTDWMPA